ncbi:OBSCN isoform 16, partial [Pan troglodytes]
GSSSWLQWKSLSKRLKSPRKPSSCKCRRVPNLPSDCSASCMPLTCLDHACVAQPPACCLSAHITCTL